MSEPVALPSRRQGYALVVSASLLWATSGLFSRLIFDSGQIQPRTLAALRVYGATILLAPAVIRARPRLSRSGWLKVAAFGVFGVSVPQWVYFEAIARIPVPIALVIVYTAPVLVTIFERFVHHRVLPRMVYLAIGIAVAGVIFAVTGGKGGAGALPVIGVLLAVITAFAYAGQIMVAAIQPPELHPIVRTGLGMMAGSLFWTVASPFWRLPFASFTHAIDLGPRLPGTLPAGVLVAGIVLFGTMIPYSMLVAGAPRIGLGASSVTGMIEPVAASILAWVALDQRLTLVQAFGVFVALGGVTVAELLRNRAPAHDHIGLVDAGLPP
jgi:drug/metabolite transporter (DMT)-like permease